MAPHRKKKDITINSEDNLLFFAKSFAECLILPCVIYLHGDLGAGKTTFCRALLNALGYRDKIKSPTYTLIENYQLRDFTCFHLDLYRLNNPQEIDDLGLRDLISQNVLFLIEWPEKGKEELPKADLHCYIHIISETQRKLEWVINSDVGEKIIARLIKND